MRVNVVIGAKTKWHTDTMRGFTRSFVAIEEGSNFQLEVRLFPHFRSSVVKYKEDLFIPHELGDKEICLIGLKDGKAHFYIGPHRIVNELEPFGLLVDHVVVGIKHDMLQVIGTNYAIIKTPKDLPLITFNDAIKESKANPQKKPRYMFAYKKQTNVWQEFWGWKHAHRWLPGTDHLCRRINVFYRSIREVAPSAFTRTCHKTGEPINWTPITW